MPRFQTIFLDLDGTLVDAFTTIHRAYQHTLPLFGLPPPTMEDVRRAIGGGLERAMGFFLPAKDIPAAIKAHLAYTEKILLEDVKLMPGAMELIRPLHAAGVTFAVLTNKHAEGSRRICAHLGVTPYLAGVFGAGDTPWLKPHREFTDHALRAIGADAATALMIGDSPFDIETGHNAGFPCWAVTTGTHNAAQLHEAKADKVFPDLIELKQQLS